MPRLPEHKEAMLEILAEYRALQKEAAKSQPAPRRPNLSQQPSPIHEWYKKRGIRLSDLE